MGKYLKKGDKIEIEGRLQVSSYTDKNDIKRTSSEVVVERLGFLQVRKEEDKLVVKDEPKKEEKLSDDVFADFGKQIEITDEDIAF